MRSRLSLVGGGLLRRPPPTTDCGTTLLELVLVMASIVVLTSLVAPLAATVADAGRARQAAEFLAARLRLTRQQAVSRSASVGLVFDVIDGHQAFRVCTDGNENGIRRADIQAGTDPCVEGPYDIAALFAGVQVAVDGSLKGPDGEAGSPDPVRFGRGEIASFSPLGTCTAGSIFLRSRQGLQYAVRLAGVTGRVRILWYDASTRVWREV